MKPKQNGAIDLIFVVLLVVVLGVGGFVAWKVLGTDDDFDPSKYDNSAKMPSKDATAFCDALTPACGYCPGLEVDGYCYWNDGQRAY